MTSTERVRRWRAANPERARESYRRWSAAWRAANPKLALARARIQYWKDPERARERNSRRLQRWRKLHPEAVREWNKKASQELSDYYVRKQLRPLKNPPKLFVEAKRAHIKLLRLLKEATP